jgi:hypothetical protein
MTLVLRFNPEADEPAREFRADLFNPGGRQIWAPHPDPAIDIAVLPVGVDFLRSQGARVSFLESDHHVLFREQAASQGLTEGDGVFALGFPMGNVGARRSFVIVRQGAIARIRDWLAGAANDFLIDASIFPGNSGGPVLNRPEVTSITGTQSVNASYLIGVVSGFISYTDVAVSAQTGRPRVTFEENTALASVVPADYIRETIAAFRAANPEAPASPPGTVTEEPPPNGNAETPPAGE